MTARTGRSATPPRPKNTSLQSFRKERNCVVGAAFPFWKNVALGSTRLSKIPRRPYKFNFKLTLWFLNCAPRVWHPLSADGETSILRFLQCFFFFFISGFWLLLFAAVCFVSVDQWSDVAVFYWYVRDFLFNLCCCRFVIQRGTLTWRIATVTGMSPLFVSLRRRNRTSKGNLKDTRSPNGLIKILMKLLRLERILLPNEELSPFTSRIRTRRILSFLRLVWIGLQFLADQWCLQVPKQVCSSLVLFIYFSFSPRQFLSHWIHCDCWR